METNIRHHSGSKYLRLVTCIDGLNCNCQKGMAYIDVYDVAEAFNVTSMPLNHAIKKILCCGIRGKGDKLQDLKEARDALTRAIQQEEAKQQLSKDVSNISKESS